MRFVGLALAIILALVLLGSMGPGVQASDNATVGLEVEVVTYQIKDLAASNPTQNSIDLTWTTPEAGTRPYSYFDVRYSTANITSDNWGEATRVTDEPAPVASASQGMKVRGLNSSTTYYFAIKLVDEEGLTGLLSNIATITTLAAAPTDTTPPARITDLIVNSGTPATTRVILSWTAPGDDGNTGTATSYEIRQSTSEITEANWALATVIYNNIIPQAAGGSESFEVSRLNPGTTYYFAIQAKDEADNPSPTSNSPSITTAAILPTIASISPTSGDNSQTRTLTIAGTNFVAGGTNVVRFVSDNNTFDLINVSCSSSTQLTADVAKGAPTGSYRVRVINDNGTSELSSATYEVAEAPTPLPVVTNLIPQMAASTTAVSGVQIFGENLAGATAVSFDGNAANITSVSDTKIIADVPGLTAGEYDVKISTPAGTNELSGVKFVVSDPVVITENTTEDTTTSGVVKLDTNVIPVQLVLTTDKAETATEATDVDADIEVTIPPQTTVSCEGEPYTGNINPPRVVKPDESVLTNLAADAVVIEMGNPEKTIDFDKDFVATITITTSVEPVIWYFNKTTHAYELAGKTGTKDGIDYVPGGTKLAEEDSTYTMGLLLDHMSPYIAGVKPHITAVPATVTAGTAFTITGTNFHPTAARVYFDGAAGTIVSRTSTTRIVVTFPTPGSYTLKVENPDKISDTTSITLTAPPAAPGGGPPLAYYIPTNLFGAEESFRIGRTGEILETIEATSEDGMLTITIPKGTIALDKDGDRLDSLEAAVDESPPDPPEDAHIIGPAYEFGPDGATFEPPITLTWSYDPEALPEDVAEDDLVVAYYDEAWVELDGVVDTKNDTITASVEHFTTFAIIGAVTPEVEVVEVVEVEEIPEEVVEEIAELEETISELEAQVASAQAEYDTAKSDLAAAQAKVASAQAEYDTAKSDVAADQAQVASAQGDYDTAKSDLAAAQAQVASFQSDLAEAQERLDEAQERLAELEAAPINWGLIGGIIAAVVVVGLLILLLVIRRRA